MIKKTKTEFAQWAEYIAGPMVIDDDTGLPHEELKPYLYSIKVGLQRFINAQNSHDTYQNAVKEIRNGKKESHWMWYIFPQMICLGKSEKSKSYGLTREEAKEYMKGLKACAFFSGMIPGVDIGMEYFYKKKFKKKLKALYGFDYNIAKFFIYDLL